MKRVVVFTGSGISAESGIKTFRDSGGLWEEHDVRDVATPEAFERNPKLVLEFYNQRRRDAMAAKPNAAHKALVKLENYFEVQIITQNVDDLHERAGSKNVLHLHGEIMKARSTINPNLIYILTSPEINFGDLCALGSQLRPHIVWFGEAVPEIENATKLANTADIFIVIGTSLEVYPAAQLIHYAPRRAQKYYIDPRASENENVPKDMVCIPEKAGVGVVRLVKKLVEELTMNN